MFGAFRPSPNISQWLETTMGANTSKVDAGLGPIPGELEASSTRRIRQQHPTSRTSSDQALTQTTLISSDHGSIQRNVASSAYTSSRATSPTSSQRSTRTALTTLHRESMVTASTYKTLASATSVLSGNATLKSPFHKRPLPPPESRETNRSQAAQVAGWEIIDASDGIYVSCQIGDSIRPESGVGSYSRYDSGTSLSDLDTKPTWEEAPSTTHPQPPGLVAPDYNVPPTVSMLPLAGPNVHSDKPSVVSRHISIQVPVSKPKPQHAANTAPSRKRKSSAPPEPKKKRRFIPTTRAIEIASQSSDVFNNMEDSTKDYVAPAKRSEFGFTNPFPDGFPLTDEEEWLLPDPHPGSCLYQDSDHEDEGYWSQIISASASVEGETTEERDERRINLLARFHGLDSPLKSTNPDKESSATLSGEALLLKKAREVMFQEQDAGAERSRRLREKALRRRGLLPEADSCSSSGKDKVFSDTHGDGSPMTHPFPNKDCDAQMEDLFDMAKENTAKNTSPEQSTFKAYRPQTGFSPPDPISGAAAEQFRTRSRHLRDGDHKPCSMSNQHQSLSSRSLSDSHPPSEDPNLEEREQRLRETKNLGSAEAVDAGRRVSSPTLGDDLTRGDFASRTSGNLLKKPSPNFAASRSAINRGREEGSVGIGLRPQSLIDRISSYRQFDEEYNDEDNNPSSGGPCDGNRTRSRPLLESELSTPKAHGAEGYRPDIRQNIRPLSGLELLAAKQQFQASRDQEVMDGHQGDHVDDSFSTTEPGSGTSLTFSERNRESNGFDEDNESASSSKLRPIFNAQMLAAKDDGLGRNDQTATNISRGRTASGTASSRTQANNGLTLPKNFDQLSEKEKEHIVQHEIAKERKRDLEAIGGVFWDFAQLLCFKNRDLSERTMQTETVELREIGKFIAIVIDQNKSGKMRRPRIQAIRTNIRSRIERAGRCEQQPTDAAIHVEMKRTFRPERVDFVDSEVKKIQEVIDHYGDLRRAKDTRKPSRRRTYTKRASEGTTKKQVRFEDEEEPGDQYSIPNQTPAVPKRTGNAPKNRRQAQFDRRDRLEQHLRAQLERFKTADTEQVAEIQTQVAETEAKLGRLNEHEDSESEEEDGADYVYGAGRDVSKTSQPDQDINEINHLEDARQKEASTHASQGATVVGRHALDQPVPSQAFDAELLRQLQLKKMREAETNKDPSIIQDKDAAVEADSDTDVETEMSSDDEGEVERQVFKYTVHAVFKGVPGYEDAELHSGKGYYDYGRAQKELLEIIAGIPCQIPRDIPVDLRNWSCNTTIREGLMEQHITFGEDIDHEARVWIEKNTVDLDERRFRQAKRGGVVKQGTIFALHWEKTVTPVFDDAEDSLDAEEDSMADLFGDDSAEEKAKAKNPVTTTIPHDEIEHFTDPTIANRHAKNVYFKWVSKFFPGWENLGALRLEDESLELDLEILGNVGLFMKENDFKRVEIGEDGAERGEVKEEFKVWVRKIALKGPGN